MVINSFLEAFSIGMLIPLFSIVFENSTSNQFSDIIFKLFNFFNIEPTIYSLIFIIGIIFVFKYSFTILFTKIQTQFILNLKANLSSRLFKDYLYRSFEFHTSTSSATLVRNIDKEIGVYLNNFISPILSFFLAAFTISFILVLLLLVNLKSTLVLILIFGLIYLCIIKLFSKKLELIGSLRQHHDRFSLKYIYEAIRTIIEVKLLELENFYKDKYFYHVNKIANISTSKSIIGVLPKIIFEISLIVIILYLLHYYVSKNLPIEDLFSQLIIYATAAFRIMPSLNLITSSNQKIKYALPAADLLKKAFNSIDKKKYIKADYTNKDIQFKNKIDLKNISFNYKKEKDIFSKINIEINKFETIGFKGKNGSGKSTLVKLICGLLKPTDGNFYVDNITIDTQSSNWKKLIGYVPQEINLIEGTIKENICLGFQNQDIDERGLEEIIQNVQLKNFIDKFPKGINTSINEMGTDISGGEKQKIGIARALFRNPEILILDESTSSLDKESEMKIISILNTNFNDKTKIIVSHRIDAFKFCDKIFEMDSL